MLFTFSVLHFFTFNTPFCFCLVKKETIKTDTFITFIEVVTNGRITIYLEQWKKTNKRLKLTSVGWFASGDNDYVQSIFRFPFELILTNPSVNTSAKAVYSDTLTASVSWKPNVLHSLVVLQNGLFGYSY